MDPLTEILKDISVRNLETHIRNLEGIRHPVTAPKTLAKAFDTIWENLQSWGYTMEAHHFMDDGVEYSNIIAYQPGTQEPEKKVIVMAHFDTVAFSPGANDNASGIAAMLALASAFRPYRFKKSILYIGVNLEEQRVDGEKGSPICRGSKALANHARENGWEIEGVVNFEEIAYAGNAVPQKAPGNFPLEFPEAGNFIAVIGNEHSADMVKGYVEGIEVHHIPLPYVPLIVPGNGEVLPDTRRSDHAPFWDNGYQAIMLTDTANFRTPHYHQPSDTIETLNLPFATEVCRAGGCLVFKMAAHDKE